jgi:hypothetical protein
MEKIRAILNSKILHCIPRILSLLDKNPYSKTYGSFDRKYWHYKIIDFPCGMQQELVLPLAYIWKTDFPGNKYYNLPRIKDYLDGIFLYHGKCMHSDGSLDDYFPSERAFGATAYTLVALTESALITGFCHPRAVKSFEQSGSFLAEYREAGILSNHLAIATLALMNLSLLTAQNKWRVESDKLVNELQARQHSEGWFYEYQGCDMGYQTVTIEFLSRRYQKSPEPQVLTMLSKSIDFLVNFMHPDGSLGGEYGSRNTYNFYPGGFAVLSNQIPAAAEILGYFFKGVENDSCNYLEDDGVFGHLLSSYVTVLRCPELTICLPKTDYAPFSMRYFSGAGLFVADAGFLKIFGSATKGGVYKVFRNDSLLNSDTGFIGKLNNGKIFYQNKPQASVCEIRDNAIMIKGNFYKYQSKRLSRLQMIALRAFSLLFGRFKVYGNLIRFIMQRLLILNRGKLDIGFVRNIELRDNEILVSDEIFPGRKTSINSLHRSTDCVNMHVITSDAFQSANLLPWEKMDPKKSALKYQKRYS